MNFSIEENMLFDKRTTCKVLGISSEQMGDLIREGKISPSGRISSQTMWFTGKNILDFIERLRVKGEHVK